MTAISIVGTGNVGTALARVFARSRVDATIANTRGPGSFPELAAEVAPTVRATTLEAARQADVLFLAIPFLAVRPFAATQPDWRVGNLFLGREPLEELLQAPVLVAGIGRAVPVQQPHHPLLDVPLTGLLPPGPAVRGHAA